MQTKRISFCQFGSGLKLFRHLFQIYYSQTKENGVAKIFSRFFQPDNKKKLAFVLTKLNSFTICSLYC